MTTAPPYEGLKVARLLMVLSSISPLFILWAIRGSALVADLYFIAFCATLLVIPNAFLLLRIATAKNLNETREIVVGVSEDHREHLLVYLASIRSQKETANLDKKKLVALCKTTNVSIA